MLHYLYTGLLAALLTTAGAAWAQQPVDLDAIQRLAAQGDRQQALAKLDERIKANADDVQARFLKGLLLLEQNNTREAREVFSEITRRFPRIPEAHNNLAAIYAREGEYELARQVLLSAIANSPDYSGVRASLGDLYAKLATDAYRKALSLNPNDAASRAKLRLLEQLFGAGG